LGRINTNTLNRLRYGFYSPVYDWLARPLASGRAQAFELLAVQPGENVLVIGAGTGLDFPYLTGAGRVTGIDLTPRMLSKATWRAAKLGLDADCRVMNAHHLDFPDGAFDVVVLHLVLAVLPDAEACISEASRVLKPSGRMSIFDKFLPDEASPTAARRVIGVATDILFSDINRRLGPLLSLGGLTAVTHERSSIRGLYSVTIARKSVS
jgi:ubiquinone/menaquinone biosynthesis C-methylase UbiE